jgi:hypothetical protein
MTCEQLDELAAELALGILPAFERAGAQGHVAGCARCRERARQYSALGDGLLELVPKCEPSVGLESRVMGCLLAAQASTGPDAPPARRAPDQAPARRGRRVRPRAGWPRAKWPRVMVAAASATLIALGGWAVGTAGNTSQDSATWLVSASLTTPTHDQAGTVYLYTGTPGWMYMKIHIVSGKQPVQETVTCQMERRDGTYVTDGTFEVRDGRGFWGGPLTVPVNDIVGARLVTAGDRTIASASLG